jgi:hypothetical protein
MNPKTINLEGGCIKFKRVGSGNATAVIDAWTPGEKQVHLVLKFNFYCWPYIKDAFQKVWVEERKSRTEEIESIDKALPSHEF